MHYVGLSVTEIPQIIWGSLKLLKSLCKIEGRWKGGHIIVKVRNVVVEHTVLLLRFFFRGGRA